MAEVEGVTEVERLRARNAELEAENGRLRSAAHVASDALTLGLDGAPGGTRGAASPGPLG